MTRLYVLQGGHCPREYEEVILRREKQLAPMRLEDMSVSQRLATLACLQGENEGLEEKRAMDEQLNKMRSSLLVR